jgi:uncharacterized membrane protein YbhN (UPF0104 family)
MSEHVATVQRPPPPTRRRIIQVALSLLLVVGIFYYLLRGIDLATVWAEIQALTWLEMATLVAISSWNLCAPTPGCGCRSPRACRSGGRWG